MLGNLPLEGVVLEVRPASMVDKHVQHVVGIHTQGTYIYNCLFHLSKCTTTTVPLWRKSAHPFGCCVSGYAQSQLAQELAGWRTAAALHLSKTNLCSGIHRAN